MFMPQGMNSPQISIRMFYNVDLLCLIPEASHDVIR